MLTRFAFASLLILLPLTLPAQLAGTIADPRLKKLIDETKLKYQVNSNGNVTVTYDVDSLGARTHQVIIYSRTEELGGFEVRTCRLYAAQLDSMPSQQVLFDLMQESYSQKLGAWEVDLSGGKYYVFFDIKLPVKIDAKAFRRILGAYIDTVDAREKQLTGGKDDY